MRGMKWITKMVMEMMMEMVLVLAVVLMELRGGMEKTSGGDSGGVSPLRSSPAAAFCLSGSGFVFLRRLPAKLLGGLFISLYRSF